MKVTRFLVLLAVLAGPSALVRADAGLDFSSGVSAVPSRLSGELRVPAAARSSQSLSKEPPPNSVRLADPLEGGGLIGTPGSSLVTHPGLSGAQEPAAASIRELPALPGSDTLFLAAMLSAGVWQGLRKARHAHWGHLPDWYHVDAPHQIGHSVAFDPVLGFELLAVCVFDAPLAAEPTPFPDISRELPSRCESQHLLTIESPRGPPSAFLSLT